MEAPTTLNYSHLPNWQLYTLYACVWTSSILSITGSSLILYYILRSRIMKKREVFERLMFGLSLSDLVTSIVMAMQPLLIQQSFSSLAFGNDKTCQFLGFGMMLILTSYMFSCAISLHFYLSVIGSRIKLEPYCHLLPWGTGILLGILGIISNSLGFDPLLGICVFGPLSSNPNESSPRIFAAVIGWMFSSIALMAGLGGITFTFLVYNHTRRIYKNSQRHSFPGSFQSRFHYAQKREIARRSMLYTAAFMNSFLMNVVNRVANGIFKDDVLDDTEQPSLNLGKFIMMLVIFLGFPIQGFLNCIVYFHPKVLRWRNQDGSKGIFWAIGQALTSQENSSSNQGHRLSSQRSFRSFSVQFLPPWLQKGNKEEAEGIISDTMNGLTTEDTENRVINQAEEITSSTETTDPTS